MSRSRNYSESWGRSPAMRPDPERLEHRAGSLSEPGGWFRILTRGRSGEENEPVRGGSESEPPYSGSLFEPDVKLTCFLRICSNEESSSSFLILKEKLLLPVRAVENGYTDSVPLPPFLMRHFGAFFSNFHIFSSGAPCPTSFYIRLSLYPGLCATVAQARLYKDYFMFGALVPMGPSS